MSAYFLTNALAGLIIKRRQCDASKKSKFRFCAEIQTQNIRGHNIFGTAPLL
jgi:hypothetical protein